MSARPIEVNVCVLSVPACIDWLPDGAPATRADLRCLARSPWNELVVDGRGTIYLNNIGFDFPGGTFAPSLLALVTSDGAVGQIVEA